jgi:hypothetical protein
MNSMLAGLHQVWRIGWKSAIWNGLSERVKP